MANSSAPPTFDIILIGGGTSGCVLASRISTNTHLSILLLEAGINRNDDASIKTPGLTRRLLGSPDYDWRFVSAPQSHLNGREIVHPRGRVLGGSSAINSLCLAYPSRAYHEAWAEFGNPSWNWEAVAPYYRKFQTLQLGREDVRKELGVEYVGEDAGGMDGPIRASFPVTVHPLQKVWIQTFQKLGYDVKNDPIDGMAIGGLTLTNTVDAEKGERSHAGSQYLQLSDSRPNLTVEVDAVVEKIMFDGPRDSEHNLVATGVRYVKGGIQITAQARKEVILCAGAFGSPQILELSGIGRKEVLASADVPCLYELNGVGENLQDHINCGVSVEVHDNIQTADGAARDPALARSFAEAYDKNRTGPPAQGTGVYSFGYTPLQMLGFGPDEHLQLILDQSIDVETNPMLKKQYDFVRRMALHPDEATATLFMSRMQRHPDAAGAKEAAEQVPGNFVTVVAMLSHPFSRGTVHVRSGDPTEKPVVDFQYLQHPLDTEILGRHLIQIERLLEQPPLSNCIKPRGRRLPRSFPRRVESIDDAREMLPNCATTNYHPAGTCSMMSEELGGVVDENLKVYGTSNLRVCDASVLPILPRANILTTVYAVAERAADIVLSEYEDQ